MSDRSNLRLLVLGALLFSLILTMLGRLFFLQVVSADVYNQIGAHNSVRDVITPATRGLILDQAGRPLVNNRTSLVVSLDRAELESQQDEGVAVLKRLAGPLHTTYEALFERIQLCGTKYAVSGSCWNGSPFQPIPVAKDVSTALALSIMERRADFPGVMAQLESVREYPEIDGVNAAHMLGYLGAVSQGELTAQQQALDAGKIDAAQATLTGTDLVGRSGLEAQYDDQLRGKAGVKALSVDISANVIGTASETDPTPGDYVVTNVDARLQAVVEKQLLAAVKRARSTTQPGTGRNTRRTLPRQWCSTSPTGTCWPWRRTRATTRRSGSAGSPPRSTRSSPRRSRTSRSSHVPRKGCSRRPPRSRSPPRRPRS